MYLVSKDELIVQIFAFLTLFCFSFQFVIFSSYDDITNLPFRN